MTEDQIQAQCVLWFSQEYPRWRKRLFAIPNGRKRSAADAAILKATGVIRGPADLCLGLPGGHVMWLECKTPTGSQSEEQIAWQEDMESIDHIYKVFRSLDEFKAIIWQIIGK